MIKNGHISTFISLKITHKIAGKFDRNPVHPSDRLRGKNVEQTLINTFYCVIPRYIQVYVRVNQSVINQIAILAKNFFLFLKKKIHFSQTNMQIRNQT